MLKIRNLIMITLAGAAFLPACNSDNIGEEQETESGLKYTYLRKGVEQKPDSGQVITLHMVYATEDDSVIFDSREQDMPIAVPTVNPEMKGLLAEGFGMLHKGDSIRFVVPAEDFFTQTARMPVPAGVEKDASLVFNIGVQDVVSEDQFREMQMAEYKKQQEAALKQQEEQLAKDVITIEEYLKENNIDAQKTESGLYYVVKEEGSGPEVESGDAVDVHYTGTLLDGTTFDSSEGRGPLTVPVGQGRVIRGWDEGLQELREGSKATFYIPSPLGYGPRNAGEVIKPNSILVFDINVVDVKE